MPNAGKHHRLSLSMTYDIKLHFIKKAENKIAKRIWNEVMSTK